MNIKMTKDMKKISMILGGAILVFAAGCQKLDEGVTPDNTDAPQLGEGQKVELLATLPATRTTLSPDFKLAWNKSDVLAVFNAPTGTENYSGNLEFAIDENAKGIFSPAEGVEVPFDDGVNYDWFVCCPHRVTLGNVELKTPIGESADDGYFPIGLQSQTGYNSPVHIAGTDIMVGKSTNTRTPVVNLKHLGVLHKFTVTNNSDAPTIITKLTLDGGDNILFGSFRIDLRAENPAIDVTKAGSTYAKRDLNVNGGGELAVGESADFYMMTAPFTLSAGETFKVTIETTTGTQVVSKTAPADIEFKAGTYNTASLVYDYSAPDYLYKETIYGDDSTHSLPTSVNQNFDGMGTRWKNYLADLSGLSVYDGVKSAVTYTWTNVQPSAQIADGTLVGMDGAHLWFNNVEGSCLIVSGIRLHGYTALNLSFVMTYQNAGLNIEYTLDDGTEWRGITSKTLANTKGASENCSFDFTVEEGHETINLRFTRTVAAPRIDNIRLTWQQEE